MASFSIFVEPAADGLPPGEGAVREGSTLAYTRGMQLGGSDVLITVVGEVPVNTARIVADSVGRE
jgi:sigma-E factor negative regulatory protein RseB